jgi:hypothetical protein
MQARSTPAPPVESKPRPAPKGQTETRSAPAPHTTVPPQETRHEEKRRPERPQ